MTAFLNSLWVAIKKPFSSAYNWLKTHQSMALLTNILLAIITGYYAYLTKIMLTEVKEQKEIALKSYQGTIRPIVDCKYSLSDFSEAFVIKNKGIHNIPAIQARKRYFFVFPNDKILTVTGILTLIDTDKDFAKKIEETGLRKEDLNPARIYDFGEIKSGDEAIIDIYQFDNTNALLLAKTLKCKFIVRWTIDYENAINFETQSTRTYFLIDENGVRQNLNSLLGGKSLIEKVQTFADTTMEEIFRRQ